MEKFAGESESLGSDQTCNTACESGAGIPAHITRRRRSECMSSVKTKAVAALLLGHNRIFQPFADTEFKGGLGGNLNRLARLGIAPLARFAF